MTDSRAFPEVGFYRQEDEMQEFGNNEPHCYVGKIPDETNLLSHYLPVFAEHMRTMAPKGADVESWRH